MDSVLLGAVRKLLQQRGYVTSPRLCRTGRLLEPTCLASFKCKKVEHARDGSSIFGKYADRPTTVQPGQVVGVMALLMSGFSRAEAMDKMEATGKMAEAIRRRWATTPSMFTVLMATTRRWPNMNLRGKHSNPNFTFHSYRLPPVSFYR